ncbi:MAG: GguC family protein [Azospirillaceae bacterium]|nr:GguC family protein [Azospirillaceae bacterium]
MSASLVQLRAEDGTRLVALVNADGAHRVLGVDSTYALARQAIAQGKTLLQTVEALGLGEAVDVAAALAAGRVLAPIDHPDSAHLVLAGTGLTHLGSAEGRDAMHKAAASGTTDSMRMFKMGLDGGKPPKGEVGVQPEWFYKGDGGSVIPSGAAIPSPAFALDGGEEPELAGIYIIGDDGVPYRLGHSLANEFSDHVTERGNYLWLAHSKLRNAALGAELLLGDLPQKVEGTSRILRDGKTLWEKPFLSGEGNMSHSLDNLEHHHFKYAQFRRPGDVHVHFFGTATLSVSDGIKTQEGDVFEISAAPFRFPLSNRLTVAAAETVVVRAL